MEIFAGMTSISWEPNKDVDWKVLVLDVELERKARGVGWLGEKGCMELGVLIGVETCWEFEEVRLVGQNGINLCHKWLVPLR